MLLPDVLVSEPQTFAGNYSGDGSDRRVARSPMVASTSFARMARASKSVSRTTIILKPKFTSASPSDGLHKLGHQLHKRYYVCTGTIAPSEAMRVLVVIAPQGRQVVDQDEVVPSFTDSIQKPMTRHLLIALSRATSMTKGWILVGMRSIPHLVREDALSDRITLLKNRLSIWVA